MIILKVPYRVPQVALFPAVVWCAAGAMFIGRVAVCILADRRHQPPGYPGTDAAGATVSDKIKHANRGEPL